MTEHMVLYNGAVCGGLLFSDVFVTGSLCANKAYTGGWPKLPFFDT